MAKRIYFLTVQRLKEKTPVNFNVEPQLITMSIDDAQEINIQQAVGTVLYKKLETLIENGNITEAGNSKYKTLLDDLIEPALIRWVLVEVIQFIHLKIQNKTIAKENSDNSVPADMKELYSLRGSIKNKAEFYTERLINFLVANSSDYPEYSANSDCDEMKPSKSQYSSGIVLGSGSKCNNLNAE